MAKKNTDTEINTTDTSHSLFDMIDNKIEQERLSNLNRQAQDALFDNSHKAENLNKVYEEVDTKTLRSAIHDEGYDDFNPFYGSKNALNTLKKHNYNEIVSEPSEPAPTIEIKEEIKTEPEKKPETQRKKLWLITGGVCIALFLSLFTYNMISINSLFKKIATTQNDITQQEQVLEQGQADYQERLTDLDLIATEGMVEADLSGATGVDLSAKNVETQYQPTTNFWDILCNFFAKLFGR